MCRAIYCTAFLLLLACLSAPKALGQFGGSRAGVEAGPATVEELPKLERRVVEGFIAIDGRAEIRVRPTEIRIVLAVAGEGKTAQECQQTTDETINQVKASWTEMGIPAENVVVDFIAILPRYEWDVEKRDSGDVGVERRAGFRIQTNLHLAVSNDANAMKALTRAFEQGVTDVIAFDYWSKELDEIKVKAREQAIQAARSKSDVLLALFDQRPSIINVQEHTTVHRAESLYHSFVNAYAEEVTPASRRGIPFIRAYRPRNTYYRGLYTDGDIQPRELPMHPELSVVSTVRLYFESPSARGAKQRNDNEKM